MLNPSDSVVDWVLKTVPTMARAGARPDCSASASAARGEGDDDGQGSADGALDMHELLGARPKSRIEELRIELYTGINALGIARRAWAACPRCSTSRSATIHPRREQRSR